MALYRATCKMDEEGRFALPSPVRRLLKVETCEDLIINVLRIKGTTRYPHAVLFTPVNPPKLSALEVVMERGIAVVDDSGKVHLPRNIMSEMRMEKDYRLEMKVQGPHNEHWLILYNRGPWIETTLRKRMGVNRGNKSGQMQPNTQVWDY